MPVAQTAARHTAADTRKAPMAVTSS
jgi:hypothetical protein